MTRRPPTFRQADVIRAVKGAKLAGLEVGRVEIGETIVIWAKESAHTDIDPVAAWEATRANKA